MALFNYTAKEITLKVVYYGPGFSGKTTNLQHLHSLLPSSTRGKLISLTTEADRTLFFDFLPIEIGKIKDFNIRFQLYTVPGQVRYNATRRLVLRGADAVVFVADSQKEMKEQNIESLDNMRENLKVNNIDPDDTPLIFQYNKRDIKNIMSIEELNSDLNKDNTPFFESVAIEGKGIQETFNKVTGSLIKHIAKKHKVDLEAPIEILSSVSEPSIPKPSRPEVQRPVVATPKPSVFEPLRPKAQKPVIAPPEPQQVVKPTTITLDLSELVSAIGELRGVMSEIGKSLNDMQKKQTKISNELYELRRIFSEAKKEKGLKRFFR